MSPPAKCEEEHEGAGEPHPSTGLRLYVSYLAER